MENPKESYLIEDLRNTIEFLSEHYFCPTKEEVHRFFLNKQISLQNYKELLATAITSGSITFLDDYIYTEKEELKGLINRRIFYFKELKEVIKKMSDDIRKILGKPYVLFVGIYPSKKSKLLIIVKKDSKELASLRLNLLKRKWQKKRPEIEIVISDSSQEYFNSRQKDIHQLSFELMNMTVVLNRANFYEKFLGHLLYKQNAFPNYPLVNFKGIKFEKNLPEKAENSPVTKGFNKIAKFFN